MDASAITANSGTSATSKSQKEKDNTLQSLDTDQFLKLMISELQNQDPLDPLKNNEILAQISQIREIGATTQLSSTLDAVLLGQNLTSATSMIGKQIEALTDDAKTVKGIVDKVTVTNGDPRLHIGDTKIRLTNVKEVLTVPAAADAA